MEINIYKELELDPNVRDVRLVIDAANQKIKEWNSYHAHPTKKLAMKDKVKLFKEIIAMVEKNPAIINTHAAEYEKMANEERTLLKKQLKDDASFLISGNEIDRPHLSTLIEQYKIFSEKEILSTLGVTVKQEKKFKYKEDPTLELDRSVMMQIEINLKIIKRFDLYDFLSVSKTDSTAQIDAKRAEVYKRNNENTNKNATTTAAILLCGFCNDILLNANKRKSYDKSLEMQPFADIYAKIDALTSVQKIILPDKYQKLLDECKKKRIDKDKAEYFIYKYCNANGITIVEPTKETNNPITTENKKNDTTYKKEEKKSNTPPPPPKPPKQPIGKKVMWSIVTVLVIGAILFTYKRDPKEPKTPDTPQEVATEQKTPDNNQQTVQKPQTEQPHAPIPTPKPIEKQGDEPTQRQPTATPVSVPKSAEELYQDGLSAYKKFNYNIAVDNFSKAAEAGNSGAQYYLGMMYFEGIGVGKSNSTAFSYIEHAANSGHKDAAFQLASMYEGGVGVAKDKALAKQWYQKAADLGHNQAQTRLDNF